MRWRLEIIMGIFKRAGWGVSVLLASALFMLPNARAQLEYPQGNADISYMYSGYQVWVFTNTSAATSWTVPSGVTTVDVLIVAGGGAGVGGNTLLNHAYAGGGGAGGLIFLEGFDASLSSYAITVGAGGASSGANGANTIFGTYTAVGGGGAGGGNGSSTRDGDGGGSGGGGSGGNPTAGVGGAGTPGPPEQGKSGGTGNAGGAGAGGGGYSQVGANAVSGTEAGKGGDGFDASSYFGSGIGQSGWFAGGGGGGAITPGVGGQGGGGFGIQNGKAGNGLASSGGGGGGVRNTINSPVPGFGGSGVVVIRAQIPAEPLTFPIGTADYAYMHGGYQVWVYYSGPQNWTVPEGVTHADVLIVAGGGAGGGGASATTEARGGGGGAGGVIFTQNVEMVGSSYSLTIGLGGTNFGMNGGNSSFGSLIAHGGGSGGGGNDNSTRHGKAGGSGGGGSGHDPSGTGGAGTNGQGRAGGAGQATSGTVGASGGGGGYATAGSNAVSPEIGGSGGAGFNATTYFGYGIGDSGWFAGGGGGAGGTTMGAGGQGGGAAGILAGTGNNAMPNTGGGGGSVRNNGSFVKIGYGGSGTVVIRAQPSATWSPLTNVTRNTTNPDSMDVTVKWRTVPGNTYHVYSSTSIPGGWSEIAEIVADATTESFDVSDYASSTMPRRFFQVAPEGFPISELNPWGVINVPIEPGMNLVGVPVWLAEVGISTNLNGANSLGALLAGMLHSSDKLHIWTWDPGPQGFYWEELVRDGNTWERPSTAPPTVSGLAPGRAFFVERVENSSTYLTFVAPVGNRNDRSIVITDADQGWNPISLSEGRSMTIRSAFTNLISGAPQGSGNPRFADRVIEIRPNGTAAIFSRQTDGIWLLSDQSGQSNGNGYLLQPGRAYFYERKAASDMEVRF